MPLKIEVEDISEVDEKYHDLYEEQDGKYALTGIVGMKTQGDIERLTRSLKAERDAHKSTKEKLSPWSEFEYDDVVTKLDRFSELEAAAAGKFDESAIEEAVTKRAEARINQHTAPLQRQLETIAKERDDLASAVSEFKQRDTKRSIHDQIRKAATGLKVIPEALDDALLLGEHMFEVREDDGAVVTRENSNAPGLTPDMWLAEMQASRPHWFGMSSGGGARPGSSGGVGGSNPWSKDHWSMAAQVQYEKSHGSEKAAKMAERAGTTLGGLRPKR